MNEWKQLTLSKLNLIISYISRKQRLKRGIPSDLSTLIFKFYFIENYTSKLSYKFRHALFEIYQDLHVEVKSGYKSFRLHDPLKEGILNIWNIKLRRDIFCYFIGICSDYESEALFKTENDIYFNERQSWKSPIGIAQHSRNFYFIKNGIKQFAKWKNFKDIKPSDKLRIIADFRDEKKKIINFYLNGKLINENTTIVLPNNKNHKKWFPCFNLYCNQSIWISFDES